MNLTHLFPSGSSRSSLRQRIVSILRQYGASLPIHFLANLLGLGSSDIEPVIQGLRDDGVLRIDGDKVSLASKG